MSSNRLNFINKSFTEPINLLVCGDRNWDNYSRIKNVIEEVKEKIGIWKIIEGGCKGADTQAKTAAKELNIPVFEYKANWDKYGKAAGPVRNAQMLNYHHPPLVLAFHNNFSSSKGTLNMVTQAKEKGAKILIITDNDFSIYD